MIRPLALLAALFTLPGLVACDAKPAPPAPAQKPAAPETSGKPAAPGTVIQYDCIPNYANWGGVTEAYWKRTGVRVPP